MLAAPIARADLWPFCRSAPMAVVYHDAMGGGITATVASLTVFRMKENAANAGIAHLV